MKRLCILMTILVCAYFSIKTYAQTKRALVIGLGVQLDSSWGKINGDKDIPYVTSMLKEAGFKDVVSVSNEKATKAKITNILLIL